MGPAFAIFVTLATLACFIGAGLHFYRRTQADRPWRTIKIAGSTVRVYLMPSTEDGEGLARLTEEAEGWLNSARMLAWNLDLSPLADGIWEPGDVLARLEDTHLVLRPTPWIDHGRRVAGLATGRGVEVALWPDGDTSTTPDPRDSALAREWTLMHLCGREWDRGQVEDYARECLTPEVMDVIERVRGMR
jgi:hypothetical protein